MHKLRSLTAHEEIYWLLNYNMPIQATLTAHVFGKTSPDSVRDALDALLRRHPLLSVSIEEPVDDRKYFRQHRGASIPLRTVAWTPDLPWESEIEAELSMPFVAGQCPLFRVVLLQRDESFALVLVASHSIADGVSLTYLVRDLLEALSGKQLAELPIAPSEEDLLNMPPVPFQQVEHEQGSAADSAYAGKRPHVRVFELDQELTTSIETAARRNQTTVHGALAAAFTFALQQRSGAFTREPVRFISPVNVRSLLAVGEDCGMYFASPQIQLVPEPVPSCWEIARSVRDKLVQGASHEAVLAGTEAMRGMVSGGLTRRGAADLLHGVFAEDMLLTNLGRTPFDPVIGAYTLKSLWPAVLASLPQMQTIGIATTAGVMSLIQTSYEPVEGLLEAVALYLRTQCRPNDN